MTIQIQIEYAARAKFVFLTFSWDTTSIYNIITLIHRPAINPNSNAKIKNEERGKFEGVRNGGPGGKN
jgi:hypothetical protein